RSPKEEQAVRVWKLRRVPAAAGAEHSRDLSGCAIPSGSSPCYLAYPTNSAGACPDRAAFVPFPNLKPAMLPFAGGQVLHHVLSTTQPNLRLAGNACDLACYRQFGDLGVGSSVCRFGQRPNSTGGPVPASLLFLLRGNPGSFVIGGGATTASPSSVTGAPGTTPFATSGAITVWRMTCVSPKASTPLAQAFGCSGYTNTTWVHLCFRPEL